MSTPVYTIEPWKNPAEAAHLMTKYDIGRLPVVDEGQRIGIITRSDAMSHFYGLCPLNDRLDQTGPEDVKSTCEKTGQTEVDCNTSIMER